MTFTQYCGSLGPQRPESSKYFRRKNCGKQKKKKEEEEEKEKRKKKALSSVGNKQ